MTSKTRSGINGRLLTSLLAVALLTVPADAQRRADLSRLVIIGDSLAAGYLNGSLHEAQQPHGFASLIARQRKVDLDLPLIAAPGIPSVLTLLSPGPPPVIEPAAGVSIGRIDPILQATNLAVPGHNVLDALQTKPGWPIDSLTDLILGLPGLLGGAARSQVEWAEALAPTTIIVWVGSNDALRPAILGDPAFLTPLSDFRSQFSQLLTRLAATGATLVVANIPDVTTIPYVVPAEQLATLIGSPLAAIGPILGVRRGDAITLDSLPLAFSILSGAATGPLPPNAVLTRNELSALSNAVDAYNRVIRAQALAAGAALVDINGLTQQIHRRGYVVRGVRLTTSFLGGIFSLDGVHPTYTGHAIVANEFIRELNTKFAAGIPPVPVERVAIGDPLFPKRSGRPSPTGANQSELHPSLETQ